MFGCSQYTRGVSITARRDRRHLRHEQTKAEIVAAAWRAARADGLAAVSLRGLARELGVEPQSLYTYFAAKGDIYGAMFQEANQELLARQDAAAAAAAAAGGDDWERFLAGTREFVQFATEDPVRYLLLFQRTVPGFVPSEQSMALARRILDQPRRALAALGVTDPAAVDLILSGVVGLVAQQNANEPGGDRWTRLTERMVRALVLEVGGRLPAPPAAAR